jgi:hypothetical protein
MAFADFLNGHLLHSQSPPAFVQQKVPDALGAMTVDLVIVSLRPV